MINWNQVKRFRKKEFSEDPDKFANPEIIYNLNSFALQLNKSIYPSTAKGALARLTGSKTSQHYAIKRKASAIDFFAEGVPLEAFYLLLNCQLFNGIGVYLDTIGIDGLPWVMFHVDLRLRKGSPLLWVAMKGYDYTQRQLVTKYYYPQQDSIYWDLFKNDKLYTYRQHRNKHT